MVGCRNNSSISITANTPFSFSGTSVDVSVGGPGGGGGGGGGDPDFVSGVKNVTVPEGRDVVLSCAVRNLGEHRVSSQSFACVQNIFRNHVTL